MAIPKLLDCERDPESAIEQERKDQADVLRVLIDEHPIRMTVDELILVMHADPERGDPTGVTKNAVLDLVSAGLLHRQEQFVVPTRAASISPLWT